mmetsp:Transcript_12641/g.46199  ORF Transcript_12641/g.46199 Transcript_12641/m.46199 type:complete len:96 (-) Transcript_12641:1242-1529(-)
MLHPASLVTFHDVNGQAAKHSHIVRFHSLSARARPALARAASATHDLVVEDLQRVRLSVEHPSVQGQKTGIRKEQIKVFERLRCKERVHLVALLG